MSITLDSTLTGSIKNIDVELIRWESDKLNNIIDVCIKLATSFMEGCGENPYPYQIDPMRRIFRSILTNDGANLSLLLARQSGKTSLVAASISTLLIIAPLLAKQYPDKYNFFKKGIMIGVFAPTAEQVATTHSRVEKFLSQDTTNAILNDPDMRATKKYETGIINIYGNSKKVKGNFEYDWLSYVRFQTSAKQAKIESKSYHILFVDECQEVDDLKLLKSIRPMLAAYNGTSVYIGTPSPYTCEFYNTILKNRANDISKPDYLRNHYEYDCDITSRYNVRYKRFIDGEKERLGEDSDAFLMSYKLQWLVDKGMALTPVEFNKYLADENSDINEPYIDGFTYVGGLDLGKGLDDPSLLTIGRLEKDKVTGNTIKRVVFWKEFTDNSWEIQFTNILIYIRAFKVSSLAVDSTGKGDPIADRLKATLADEPITILPVNFNIQSKHNMATEFYEEMFKNKIKIPCGKKTKNTKEFKKFYGEWMTAVKTYTGKYLQLEHPRDIQNAHDDYVDSLLLMIQAAKKVDAVVIRQETMNWRQAGIDLASKSNYRSIQTYARARVNEIFNRSS